MRGELAREAHVIRVAKDGRHGCLGGIPVPES